MNQRAGIIVTGIVQGVYFRYNTRKKAYDFGLKGWVRNLSDGTVEIVCEGEKERIEQFVTWCRRGPEGAHVEQVDVDWKDPTGEFDDFRILY
jgi:acylphosphatase